MAVKTSAKKIRVAELQATALQLRRAGLSFSRIAEQLGISVGYANKLTARALREFRVHATEDASSLMALSLARLDGLLVVLWPKAIAGSFQAVDRVLAVESRRARLLGLDSPLKIAPTNPGGKTEYQGGGMSALRALYRAQQGAGDVLPHSTPQEPKS